MRTVMTIGLISGLLTAGLAAWPQGTAPDKKLIAVGWDMPNAERLRANLDLMDATPLQGCSVRFAGPGNKPAMWYAFGRDVWDQQAVAQILEDLKAVQPRQLRDRFLLLNANPGDVDWFDDAGWAAIVEHWRIAARVAREGGLKGLMFDPEAYRDPFRQFDWSAQAQADQHSFAAYCEKARQRGREVMAAVAAEYPEATVLALFLLSVNREAAERSDPTEALSGRPYGLLPSFVDGWLDAAPPTLNFVDGCENAYRFNSHLEYLAAANLIRNNCQRLVSPENRYKYRAQVQVGFGVYLDAYVNPPTSPWYIDPGTQTPVRRLAENVASALEVADEYVWIYGEQASWWPSPHPVSDKIRWPQKLPGIEEVLRLAADPGGYAVRLLSEPGERTNVVVNGDFTSEKVAAAGGPQPADWKQGTAPPGWSFWQTKVSTGHPTWDREVGHISPGAGALVGVKSGCLIQSFPVKPGERYVVGAWRRIQGEGTASVRLRWQTAEGKWHAESLDVFLNAAKTSAAQQPEGVQTPAGAGQPGTAQQPAGNRESAGNRVAGGEWKLLAGVGVVPEGAGKLVVLLSADGQRTDKDVMWWDDITAYRVD
jgi:hypothetical protein